MQVQCVNQRNVHFPCQLCHWVFVTCVFMCICVYLYILYVDVENAVKVCKLHVHFRCHLCNWRGASFQRKASLTFFLQLKCVLF